MNTEEPKPYNYSVAAQDLSTNPSPDVPPNKPGTDGEEPQLEVLLKSSPDQPSHNIHSTTVHEEEKTKPQSSAEEGRHGFRSTLQQWGEMTFEEKFKPSAGKHKFNDIWATIFFCAVLIAFVIMSAFCIHAYHDQLGLEGLGIYDAIISFTLNTGTIILFSVIVATAFVLSFIYFTLARLLTKQFIWVTGILHCLLGLGVAIPLFILHYLPEAIVFVVFTAFYLLCFFSWRKRIPFATRILDFTLDVTRKYPSTLLVSFIGLVFTLAFGAWWIVSFVTAYIKYHPGIPGEDNPACKEAGGNCSNAGLVIVLIFFVFTGYYISEIIKNVIHATIAGIYGAYFFGYNTPAGVPRHAAMTSFYRCMTYSFGSICLGSLVVSILQFLRQLVSIGKSAFKNQGHTCYQIGFCWLECLATLMEGVMQYFNHYAYTHIALYGKGYSEAARDTWTMIKSRGVDAIINDLLIDNVLTMGSVFVAFLTAFLSYLYLRFTDPAYNLAGGFYIPIIAFGFLIGLQMTNIAVVAIKSGVATMFVVMAEDPDVLAKNFPDLYKHIITTYPQFAQGIPGLVEP